MTGEDTHKSQAQLGGNMPGPDVMLGVWAYWMDQMSASVRAPGPSGPIATSRGRVAWPSHLQASTRPQRLRPQ